MNKEKVYIYFKATSIILLLILAILFWIPIIMFALKNGLLDEKVHISDYYYFHYSFENVWHNQPSHFLYDCARLQAELKTTYNIDSLPNACFLYPPHFAVFFSWLGIFSFNSAEYVWNILLNSFYTVGIILFIKLVLGKQERITYKYTFSFLFILSILHYPYIFDFYTSNSNRLTFFLVAVMFYLLYEKKRDFWAGIPLGLAIVFKVTPAIILVFYLLKGRTQLALGTLTSIIASTLLVIMTIGWETLWRFATHDFWGFSKKLIHFAIPFDNSIQGILTSYFPNAPSTIIFCLYILSFLVMYIYLLQKNKNQNLEIGLIALSPLLFSPHLEIHHLILAIFAQIILANYLWINKPKGTLSLILKVLCVIVFYIFIFIRFWTANGEHFLGLMMLFFSLALIIRRETASKQVS